MRLDATTAGIGSRSRPAEGRRPPGASRGQPCGGAGCWTTWH